MLFLFLCLAAIKVQITFSLDFCLEDATITFLDVSEGTVSHMARLDGCSKMVVKQNQVHHLSTEFVYESWSKGSLETHKALQTIAALTVFDYSVSSQEKTVVFIQRSLDNLKTEMKFWTISNTGLQNPSSTELLSTPDSIFMEESFSYMFYSRRLVVDHSIITKVDRFSNHNRATANFSSQPSDIAISPDYQIVIAWNESSFGAIYRGENLTLQAAFIPEVVPPVKTTGKVAFSGNSRFAAIETDHYNPIVIIDLNDYSIISKVSINDTVTEVFFLQEDVLIVFCPRSTFIVDLSNSNKQYVIPTILGTTYGFDFENNIFTCRNNVLRQVRVIFKRNVSVNQTDFFISLQFDNSQAQVFSAVNNSLTVTTKATTVVTSFASSTPLMIYFLGFINYFTLNSLYVFLSFKLPEHVYHYLSQVLNQLSGDLISMSGLQVQIPQVSDQKIDNEKALFFNVSSDICSSQTMGLILLVLNLLGIACLVWLSSKLDKDNFFRKLFKKEEEEEMRYGQFINLLFPFSLPWYFATLKTGFLSLGTKINTVLSALFLLVAIIFPIYYLFWLIHQRRRELVNQTRKMDFKISDEGKIQKEKKQPQKRVRFNSQIQSEGKHPYKRDCKEAKTELLLTKISNKKRVIKKTVNYQPEQTTSQQKYKFTLQFLLTGEVVEQWYLCQANFIYPALVLLPRPEFFLVCILLFTMLGTAIAYKKTKQRVNSVVMTLYPFFFHICFMVFYWSDEVSVLLVTQIVCLAVFLLGSLHHCIVLIYEIVIFFKQMLKKTCAFGKVQPLSAVSGLKQKNNQPELMIDECRSQSLASETPPHCKTTPIRSVKIKKTLDFNSANPFKINLTLKEGRPSKQEIFE